MKQDYSDEEKKIAGSRLENLLYEMKCTRKELVVDISRKTHFTDAKLSEYINGKRPIPDIIAREIVRKFCAAESEDEKLMYQFLTDKKTFYELVFDGQTYENFKRSRDFASIASSDLFKRYQAWYSLMGFSLGVWEDEGISISGHGIQAHTDLNILTSYFQELVKIGSDYLVKELKKDSQVKTNNKRGRYKNSDGVIFE